MGHETHPSTALFQSGLFSSSGKRVVLLSLSLVLVTLLLYQPALKFGFINYDDPFYVTSNIPVQNGLTWKSIHWAFTTNAVANWHPLTWLSHMADVQLFGLNPFGHHLSSVFWHISNVVLLFLGLWQLTGKIARSFVVALIFAIHPINVQSVAWISERKNLLCTFFWLLATLGYVRYTKRPTLWRYSWVAIPFSLGLMCKPMLVTFPFVLLLLDFWPLQRFKTSASASQSQALTTGKLIAEKIPLLLLAAASSAITYVIQNTAGANQLSIQLPFHLRLENALYSYVAYMGQLIWPVQLAIFYPHPIASLTVANLALAGFALALISVTVWFSRKQGYPVVGWLWFLGTLVPVIGLVQVGVQARADRYLYVPMIGLLIFAVWGVAELSEKFRVGRIVAVVLLFVAAALAADTIHQLSYWRDGVALFSRALEVSPVNNYVSHANLGDSLLAQGKCLEALPHFNYVLAKFPEEAYVRTSAAECLLQGGYPQEALKYAGIALRSTADPQLLARIHVLQGLTEQQIHNNPEAEQQFREAIAQDPNSVAAHIDLGILFAGNKRMDEAALEFSESIRILPTPLAYLNLARLQQSQGNFADALAAYEQVLRLSPGDEQARSAIAALQQQSRAPAGSR